MKIKIMYITLILIVIALLIVTYIQQSNEVQYSRALIENAAVAWEGMSSCYKGGIDVPIDSLEPLDIAEYGCRIDSSIDSIRLIIGHRRKANHETATLLNMESYLRNLSLDVHKVESKLRSGLAISSIENDIESIRVEGKRATIIDEFIQGESILNGWQTFMYKWELEYMQRKE